MLNSRAYSKTYQQLEDCMKEDSQRARKAAKARIQALSRQTAQRQKALEDKKKAMAIAEDARRRRALEDRRRQQKEAMERCRTAITHLRTTAKTQSAPLAAKNHREIHVEYYLPSKPNPPVSRTGFHSSGSSENRDSRRDDGERGRASAKGGRVALGREVEVNMRTAGANNRGLQGRVTSLEDVLRSVRGQSSSVPTTGIVHSPVDVTTTAEASHIGWSASDTDIAVPVYQGGTHPSIQISSPDENLSQAATVNWEHNSENATTLSPTSTLEGCASPVPPRNGNAAEKMVFRPVSRPHPTSFQPCPTPACEDIQVLSPENPDSCCSSPVDSLHSDTESSSTLHDSLDNPSLPIARAIVSSAGRRGSRVKPSERDRTSEPFHGPVFHALDQPSKPKIRPHFHRPNTYNNTRSNAPNYNNDSSSSSESSNFSQRYRTPPRARRQARTTSRDSKDVRSSPNKGPDGGRIGVGPETAKIVGILKKPGSSSQSSKASSVASTACQSEAVSAVGSTVMEDSNNTTDGMKGSKRVRFVDQMSSDRSKRSVLTIVDTLPTQLWNKVFPNGFSPHFPPNSAFTPKMRVSLNSNGLRKKPLTPPGSPPNGLVVRVPLTTDLSSNTDPKSSELTQTEIREVEASPGQPQDRDGQEPSTEHSRATETQQDNPDHRQIHLDKTPTDDDINELWHEIKTFFRGKDRVMVPAHEYKFTLEKPGSQQVLVTLPPRQLPQLSRRHNAHGHAGVASPHGPLGTGGQKQLVHRQTNRPLRCHTEIHRTPQALEHGSGHAHQKSQAYGHERSNGEVSSHHHNRHYPPVQSSQREPVSTVTTVGSGIQSTGVPVTGLSVEEQRLMDSIAKLNLRLRNRQAQNVHHHSSSPEPLSDLSPSQTGTHHHPPSSHHHPPSSHTHPPSSHTHPPSSHHHPPSFHRHPPSSHHHPPPSHHHPPSHHPPRNNYPRGLSDLPRTRVRRNPKTIALAAAMNAQLKDSRTQLSIPVHRQCFYNT